MEAKKKNSGKLKVIIGSDHAGFTTKEVIKYHLIKAGYQVKDFGTHSGDSTDYPDYAHPVSEEVNRNGNTLGVLVCGSGNGVAMTANKHPGIRAAVSWNEDLAALARQHNDANVVAIPARFISEDEAVRVVEAFLDAHFEGGRHARRVGKIAMSKV